MVVVDRSRLASLTAREQKWFKSQHPKSQELFEQAHGSLYAGVPMLWMMRFAGGFPVFLEEAVGARVVDVDGNEYVDFCLGDTGAMTGHAPAAVADAVARQVRRGSTAMLPSRDVIWLGNELKRRFGLAAWQLALTATDANRFAIRVARAVTGRTRVLVFNWCYHGTVDESFATLQGGDVLPRIGNLGYPVPPAETTRVVEFNDVSALTDALQSGDVACVLAEPVMTNIGIIHPDQGFHDVLRRLTRETGTLLILDETHTICTGPGGYTKAYGLEPDLLTIGKPIAGGVPAAAYGMSLEVAARLSEKLEVETSDTSGLGGTLAGNVLSVAAARATLEHVLTEAAFEHMTALGQRFADDVEGVIKQAGLPWHATRLGGRVEYLFQPHRPTNGTAAAAAWDHDLDLFMHLYMLNRGVLMTPFHNMALMSPATTAQDVARHTAVFTEAVEELLG
ncbi:transaminase [Alicyclobacillus sp. ALC3]|uniref:transaminase n=1 Tax=Alicyclobacillus sp. ALC3 TaxID=2796143 RepID=UPI002378E711|nr:transaminase [Alicyclobacillus sp. ALC3]